MRLYTYIVYILHYFGFKKDCTFFWIDDCSANSISSEKLKSYIVSVKDTLRFGTLFQTSESYEESKLLYITCYTMM